MFIVIDTIEDLEKFIDMTNVNSFQDPFEIIDDSDPDYYKLIGKVNGKEYKFEIERTLLENEKYFKNG